MKKWIKLDNAKPIKKIKITAILLEIHARWPKLKLKSFVKSAKKTTRPTSTTLTAKNAEINQAIKLYATDHYPIYLPYPTYHNIYITHFLVPFSVRQAVMLSCINCIIVTESMYFAYYKSLILSKAKLNPYSHISMALSIAPPIS